jgi:hypothetical protein
MCCRLCYRLYMQLQVVRRQYPVIISWVWSKFRTRDCFLDGTLPKTLALSHCRVSM